VAKVRAVLALVVLGLFPVAVLALLVAVVALALLAFRYEMVGAGVQVLFWLGLVLVIGLVAGLRSVWKGRPQPFSGVRLDEHEHPRLWQEVRSLAEGLQTAVPSRVVVDGTVNAAVHEVGGRRELLVGLPLLAVLSRGELRSVLAHELGHYGAGHTRLAALTYRGRDFVVAMAQGTGGPVGWLVRLLAWTYLAVAAASNRDQEHEADAYSARVAGPATAASALRAVVAAEAAWNVLADEYGGVVQDGRHGRPPLTAGVRALLDTRREAFGAAVDQVLAERRTSTFDSHPPIGVRVERFERQAVGATSPRDPALDAPGWTVLGADPQQAQAALDAVEQRLLEIDAAPRPWEDVADDAGGAVLAENAGHLARAALQTRTADSPALSALLDAVEQGRGRAMVAPLVNPGVAPQHRAQAEDDVLTSMLGAAVAHALVTQAGARVRFSWEPGWDEPFSLVLPDGRQVRFEDAVRPVAQRPDQVPALREWLRGKGVDLANETQVRAEPEPQARAAWIMVHEGATKELSVVLCDTGLLLVRVPGGDLGRKALGNATGRRARQEAERVGALLDGGVDAARQDKLCTWIDTDELVAARLRPALSGWRLDVRTDDGRRLTIRSGQHTVELGEPGYALGALFGARLGTDAWKAAAR
jgi:Zn-dependent protease with chaperone function